MASKVVKLLSPNQKPQPIEEGKEPIAFWKALGGKGKYDTEIDRPGAPILDPRLFHCQVTPAGKFRVEEIGRFEQDVSLIESFYPSCKFYKFLSRT
jgi:hypothetical protein